MRTLKYRPHRRFIYAWFAMLIALMLALPTAALAIGPMDTARATSLTIRVSAAGQPAAGVQFDLHRVADASEFADFTLTGAFAEYPVSLNGATAEEWRKLSSTLAGYAAADGLKPVCSILTDETGTAAAKGLQTGLYLVIGHPYTVGAKLYTPEATLVSLPGRDAEDQWLYDVTVQTKQAESDRDITSLEVIKIWDDGDSKERPAEITVQLLCNGKVATQIVLNQDNNWRYEWTELDGSKLWQVIERPVPDDYTVDIDYEGALATITNTRPEKPDQPSGGGNLPQTGLNWWPVWLTAAAGMLLFMLGWLRQKRSRE